MDYFESMTPEEKHIMAIQFALSPCDVSPTEETLIEAKEWLMNLRLSYRESII